MTTDLVWLTNVTVGMLPCVYIRQAQPSSPIVHATAQQHSKLLPFGVASSTRPQAHPSTSKAHNRYKMIASMQRTSVQSAQAKAVRSVAPRVSRRSTVRVAASAQVDTKPGIAKVCRVGFVLVA